MNMACAEFGATLINNKVYACGGTPFYAGRNDQIEVLDMDHFGDG